VNYLIANAQGKDLGIYGGESEVEAVCAMHEDAGYCVSVVGGELVFESEEDRRLCGDVDAFRIEHVVDRREAEHCPVTSYLDEPVAASEAKVTLTDHDGWVADVIDTEGQPHRVWLSAHDDDDIDTIVQEVYGIDGIDFDGVEVSRV